MNCKILMIGPINNTKGGMTSVIEEYLNFDKVGKNILLLSSYEDSSKINKLMVFLKSYIHCFFKLLTDKNIKIVHIHSASRGSFHRKRYFLNLAKFLNKKVIFHIHGAEFKKFYEESNERTKNNISNALSKADRVIALSNEWKHYFKKISKNSKVEVIYNPVNEMDFEKSKLDGKKILFMGRMGQRKGVYDLLDVVSELASEHKDLELYLGGDGEIDKVKKIVNDMNLYKHVKVLGWISGNEKKELFKKSSIYVLPSYNEGLPVSILEAMASGLPIVSTNIAGIPEEVEHNVNGYLIEPGDKKSLKMYISKLLVEENLRNTMGKTSIEKVKNDFDNKIIEKKILRLYNELCPK